MATAMPAGLHGLLLLLHLGAALVWLGGMAFALSCLRPAAIETLEPGPRLRLMEAALRRFFAQIAWALPLLLLSGAWLMAPAWRAAPIGWWLMAGLGLLMGAVFLMIRGRLYPRLRLQIELAAWPAAAALLERIRRLVLLNLLLGALVLVAAVAARS